ncbi:MAG TPA: Ig-like domain-containing protein [Aggregatilineales bacterium]|nr:Ig-like domain-containing protein [Aggregatilineales bacterium]
MSRLRFARRRDTLLSLWIGSFVLFLAIIAPVLHVRSAADDIAPEVVETDPFRGTEITLDNPLTLYFNVPMDRQSTEAAFATRPTIPGRFSWADDLTLTFTPTAALERAAEYVFTLSEGAKSTAGVPLKQPFRLALQTVGYLEVVRLIPADGTTDVETVPTITVIFNRPVVPLLPIAEMRALPSPIVVEPAVTGTGEWISTSIYTFKPDGLKGGSAFTVRVPKGLKDVTGSELTDDVVAKFTTLRPAIIQVYPSDKNSRLSRKPVISLTFSQPMDRSSTENAFQLLSDKSGALIAGKITWNDRNTRLTFEPDELLDYASTYFFTVATSARSATGAPLNMATDFRSRFTTLELPELRSVYPREGMNNVQASGASFEFSVPINFKDFDKRITVSPEPKLRFENYSYDYEYNFSFSHEPATTYTVTLDPAGLVDVYGTQVTIPASDRYRIENGKVVFTWSTGNYPSEASLKTGTDVGLYSAYAATTRLFSTHRNIEQINLALYELPLEELLKTAERYWYTPDLSKTTKLRSWTVKVENPANVLRYDMLTISDQGESYPPAPITCEGAPPSRLRPGMFAFVLPDDPTPLNVRKDARTDAEKITQLPVNTQFMIQDGPVCRSGIVWWNIQATPDKSIRGWVAEGVGTKYFIGERGASGVVDPTYIQKYDEASPAKPALPPGAYYLTFNSPEIPYGSGLRHVMFVAKSNLTLKLTPYGVMAWVTDLQSGQPVPNQSVTFYNVERTDGANNDTRYNVITLGEAMSDADGIAYFAFPKPLDNLYTGLVAAVGEKSHFGIGSLNWDGGIASWDFEQPSNYYPSNVSMYIYSDRSLYRPGQPIYFRGVLRDRKDITYTISPVKTVWVQVVDGRQQVIYEKELPVTDFGTFADHADVAVDAPLGYYQVLVRLGQKGDADKYSGPVFSRGVNIAEYRVPEYQVTLTPEQVQLVQGDTIRVTVESTYFFGGALSNATVEWSAFSDDYYFSYKGKGRYNFIDYNEDEGYSETYRPYGEEIATGSGTTDGQGKFVIELPASLGKAAQSQSIAIEARVRDESDQIIAGRATVIVNQGEFYIGAAPEEYIGTAGKPQQVNLITVTSESAPQPNTPLAVTVVERRWRSVQTVEPATGRTVWNYDVEEKPVTDGEVTTDADGKGTFTFTPEAGGIYKVYVTSRDSRGNAIKTSTFLWVAGPNYVPWRQQNSNRIDLKIDRDNYAVGDTANILIASPFQGETTALITVERGDIIKREVLRLPNNSYVYQLPITADLAPNAFVSVVIMKGVDETNPVPAFRVGLIGLGVEVERLKLNITATPDKTRTGPGETVTYTLKVTDYKGEPVQAEVGVGLTDLAVLSLLPDTSTPILDFFYRQQGLSIRTSASLTVSVDQQTQEILNTVKGGGGGGPEGGIFQVRQKFIDTPLWQPSVVTNEQGEATVAVTLPDQLTTWRLDARAVTLPIGETKNTLVGQNTVDILSTKPLLIRPVTPRFFVEGDKTTLVAVVNNNSGAAQEVKVHIDLTGAAALEGTERVLSIPDGDRGRFEFPIEVGTGEAVGVTFFASSADGAFTDAAKSAVGQGEEKTLPIKRYEVPETVGTGGALSTNDLAIVEEIMLPRRYEVKEGRLDIRLDRSLAASTLDALEALRYFPYYCTEQTISRFLPNLATYGAFTKLGVNDPVLKRQVEEALSAALQRLYNDQKSDGGWGWFKRDESNPLVTAYALIGLVEARSQGFTVEDKVISRAAGRLQSDLARMNVGRLTPRWQLNRQAFMLYALAMADVGSFSRSLAIYEVRESLDLYARAYLAMAFHKMDPANKTYTDTLISDLINRASISATGVSWTEDGSDYINWNTNTRSTALALKALLQIDPANPLIPNAVRWLMIARQADMWETTQETAWSVMALVDYMQYTGELNGNYTFGVTLNNTALADTETTTPANIRQSVKLSVDVADLLKGEVNRLRFNRTAGEGMLYYTAHMRVNLPVELVEAESRGITVERQYTIVGGDGTPVTEAKVGDTIRVTLTIILPSDQHYIVINDPIPAGTEAINPNLATSTVGEPPNLRLDNPFRDGWGWWWFSETELRDDRTVLYATYLPKGTYKYTYTVRAGMAGTFKVIPTTGEAFYTPEVYGRSSGSLFTIKP